MRWVILVALICAGSLFAQPFGPYLVAESDPLSELGNAKVAVDSTGVAHIFYERNDNGARFIMYAAVDASNGDIITELHAVFLALTYRVFLEDVAVTPGGAPRCLVFTADPGDYNLYVVQWTGSSWTETLLFHDQDGWSPNGPLPHWIEYCRFVAADDSFTQVCLYNTGIAGGGWITEPFASPVACFIRPTGEVSSFPIGFGGQMTFGTLRCRSLSADSMYVWGTDNFGPFRRYLVRSDSVTEELATYDLDWCQYGELAGMSVSGGDQIHVTGMTLCIPECLIFERVSGDSCSAIGDVRVYPPMNLPGTFAVFEQHGFVFPLFDQNEVQLLRVDTLATIAAPVGTIAWRDGPVQILTAHCDVSASGEIATVYTDCDPATAADRIWLASCDWLTPLGVREPAAPVPNEISLTAYPNPFNSFVRIEYDLPRAGDVRLSVFNTLGQEVATLVDERVSAGAHSLTWSPGGASGVYLVRLVSNDFVSSKKVLYIR
ncbi:MAG: T9SS type A sorting domain-containing protein [Calditrichaeota bacterium]|nr:T9SS type A sorting domain-containing protein [Calditrichota bacterium]